MKKVIETYAWLKEALAEMDYQGPQGIADMLAPTLSMLGSPDLAEEFGLEPLYSFYRDPLQAEPAAKQPAPPVQPGAPASAPDPLSIAKQRLAAGEISLEEFQRIKSALSG